MGEQCIDDLAGEGANITHEESEITLPKQCKTLEVSWKVIVAGFVERHRIDMVEKQTEVIVLPQLHLA